MGDYGEFTIPVRLFLKAYRWRRIDPIPWAPLRRPLSQCRLGLVSSAGFAAPGQEPFDPSIKGGDPSYRILAGDVELAKLAESHRSDSFDHAGIAADPNLAFPLDRVRELERDGCVGSVNRRHLSFMGSITAPGRLVRDTAPAAAGVLLEDGVDAALLVPV